MKQVKPFKSDVFCIQSILIGVRKDGSWRRAILGGQYRCGTYLAKHLGHSKWGPSEQRISPSTGIFNYKTCRSCDFIDLFDQRRCHASRHHRKKSWLVWKYSFLANGHASSLCQNGKCWGVTCSETSQGEGYRAIGEWGMHTNAHAHLYQCHPIFTIFSFKQKENN